MSTSILSTKLFIPQLRPTLVQRPRLFKQLEAGQRGKLTLVSAPAGFGKTTVVSAWLHAQNIPAGWISLDENDNDPVRFLSYFVAALQTVDNAIKGRGLENIKSIQVGRESVERESFLIRLINEIAEITHDFALVLDDYHVISNAAVQNILTFFLEHQPPQMHLILTTRADPPWALAHFRVRQEIKELRIKVFALKGYWTNIAKY
ncbi:MAG: AAA family ATPase [Anaerolineales bacterium]|nr:AAA family ATPase [Anaerolineales bacterium]